jgi:hypothetical protein
MATHRSIIPGACRLLVCGLFIGGCHASTVRQPTDSPDASVLVGVWDLELRSSSLLPFDGIPLVGARPPFFVGELDIAPVGSRSASFSGALVATFPHNRTEAPALELRAAGSMAADGRVAMTLTFAPPFSGLPFELVGKLANGAVHGEYTQMNDGHRWGGKFTLRRRGS